MGGLNARFVSFIGDDGLRVDSQLWSAKWQERRMQGLFSRIGMTAMRKCVIARFDRGRGWC
jgi:hypothetical protein